MILTSATLSVAGGFDFIRSRIGIGVTAEELTLPSPFDYLRQAVCILPEDATAYDDPVHDVHMAALIDGIAAQLDGHTLVLFTSYGPLKRVWALLQDRLEARGIASLAQGLDGTRRQILQSFLADPRTVLLATSSFWEGVDIPGDRLRCVVIDKLPLPGPDRPAGTRSLGATSRPLWRVHPPGGDDPAPAGVRPPDPERLGSGRGGAL